MRPNISGRLRPLARAGLVLALAVFGLATVAEAAPSDKEVLVVNDQTRPVLTTALGTTQVAGNVGISGPVQVQASSPLPVDQVEAPYSVRLGANNIDINGGEDCTDVPVPDGSRLILETVAVDILRNSGSAADPEAYITTTTFAGGTSIFDRPLLIPASQTGANSFAGHLQTQVITGPLSEGNQAVRLSLCAGPFTRVEGLLFGRLIPAG